MVKVLIPLYFGFARSLFVNLSRRSRKTGKDCHDRLWLPRQETRRTGFRLAIPTPAAGISTRGGKVTPAEWERRTGLRLRFIYRRRDPSLLVAEGRLNAKGHAFGRLARPHRGHGPALPSRSKTGRSLMTAPIFLLVPQVKLPKRLDLARDAERALDSVPGLIVANWVDGRS
jgi:hypothetical protein